MLIHDGVATRGKVKKRIGELLLELDLITQAQLDEVLALQKIEKKRLGTLLVERQFLTSTKLIQVLSHQFDLPFVSLTKIRYTPELLARIPGAFAKQRRVVPICVSGGDALFAATDDPTDESLSRDLAAQSGMEVRLMVAPTEEVEDVLHTFYHDAPSRWPLQPPAVPAPTGAVRFAVSELAPPPSSKIVELTEADLELIQGQDAVEGPVVLCVGVGRPLVQACLAAARAQGLRVESASAATAASLTKALSPIALVVPEEVFARDRLALTELSIQSGAHLLIWSNELAPSYLEGLFAAVAQR